MHVEFHIVKFSGDSNQFKAAVVKKKYNLKQSLPKYKPKFFFPIDDFWEYNCNKFLFLFQGIIVY
jgi:hypothetical protein